MTDSSIYEKSVKLIQGHVHRRRDSGTLRVEENGGIQGECLSTSGIDYAAVSPFILPVVRGVITEEAGLLMEPHIGS